MLTRITNRTGANGPQNPVTQYILKQAAERLADRLVGDIDNSITGDSVPRILSGALGHQPFIESVLGLSQHQMLRRWPTATDWYADVISYVMRPARFGAVHITTADNLLEWSRGTLGEFIRRFLDHQVASFGDLREMRMAEALQALWPDYPPVRDAIDSYRVMVKETWIPIYSAAMGRYGLVLRPGVTAEELAWMFNAVFSRDTLERLADPDSPGRIDSRGNRWSMTARSALIMTAGATTDLEGRTLTLEELEDREPQDA